MNARERAAALIFDSDWNRDLVIEALEAYLPRVPYPPKDAERVQAIIDALWESYEEDWL